MFWSQANTLMPVEVEYSLKRIFDQMLPKSILLSERRSLNRGLLEAGPGRVAAFDDVNLVGPGFHSDHALRRIVCPSR
jgi:hypothetical protein